MTIYLDSAIVEEARQAREFGWVRGVTTNPSLLARAGRAPEIVLAELSGLGFPEVYYQLVAQDPQAMLREAFVAQRILGEALVLKVAPVAGGFRFVAEHGGRFPCCVTAVFSPAQALVAREAGARSIAIYVNRAAQQMGDGLGLVREAAQVLAGSSTAIVAASLKSPSEAADAHLAGAQHLTAPLQVLMDLYSHDLSQKTLQQFAAEGIGLRSPAQGEPNG